MTYTGRDRKAIIPNSLNAPAFGTVIPPITAWRATYLLVRLTHLTNCHAGKKKLTIWIRLYVVTAHQSGIFRVTGYYNNHYLGYEHSGSLRAKTFRWNSLYKRCRKVRIMTSLRYNSAERWNASSHLRYVHFAVTWIYSFRKDIDWACRIAITTPCLR